MTLKQVFEPRRVALVGASDQPGKVGSLLWENLSGFAGEVIPVTTSTSEIAGRRTYPSLGDVEGPVDLAVVSIPASGVPEVARQAARIGVGALVVLSGGFAETGLDGARLQEELRQAAGATRVVGPNCFGVQNAAIGLNASIASGTSAEPGGISLITQSGAYGMAIHAMGSDENIRFGKVYASGNKVDIEDEEVIEYLRDDPDTTVICVFAESVGDGRSLARVIRSTSPRKPVIIAKIGRSDAGKRAATSHTGALGTSDVLFRSAMRQAGAVLVRSGLEMLDAARALVSQPVPPGKRAAIITNSGGTGVELVDMLSEEGVEVPELSPALQRHIAARLPAFASPRNPVDITPVWSRFAELYPWLIDTLARSGEVDVVIPVLLQRSAMDLRTATAVATAVADLEKDQVGIPVYCCWVAPRSARSNALILQEAGVPCFEWPDRTARAVGHAVRYSSSSRTVTPEAKVLQPVSGAFSPGPMAPLKAAALLGGFGIATVQSALCQTFDQLLDFAAVVPGPWVVKSADPHLAHRTERGAVKLGLRSPEEMKVAFDALDGPVLVQPQLSGVEVAMGGLYDPVFGPVVMVGLGGTNIELSEDVAFGLAPLPIEEARSLIKSLRSYPLLTGFRGSSAVDVDGLARLIVALGDLMVACPEIVELDLNPVIATSDGIRAVDWKVNVAVQPPDKEGKK